MEKIFNILLVIGILVVGILYIQKQCGQPIPETKSKIQSEEPFVNLDKVYYDYSEPTGQVQFNYGKMRPIDEQFLKEQECGAMLSTWYPNTWIERIDENGQPVYNSREKVTGVKENFIESKARFTYEFNSPRSLQMDGVVDLEDVKNGKGKTLKEIYDNSFVDYKKMIPVKNMLATDEQQLLVQPAGSNLSYIMPDTWVYEGERLENGGVIEEGLMASDPYAAGSIANSLAVIDY